MTEPNVPLLRQVLGHIKTHPSAWDQTKWRRPTPCGTALCFAGWTVELAGGARWHERPGSALLEANDDDPPEHVMAIGSGGRWTHVRLRAQRLLGLSEEEATDLFHAANNLAYIEQAVEELCARAEGRAVADDEPVAAGGRR